MAQKAKFKFLGTHELTAGIIVNDLELHDADNDVSRYIVTDYYNASKTKIVETTIEKELNHYPNLHILTQVSKEHYYPN